jgi:hypothetical protein
MWNSSQVLGWYLHWRTEQEAGNDTRHDIRPAISEFVKQVLSTREEKKSRRRTEINEGQSAPSSMGVVGHPHVRMHATPRLQTDLAQLVEMADAIGIDEVGNCTPTSVH